MGDLDLFEPGTQIFTGVVRSWSGAFGELVTDSGLSLIFVLQGQGESQPKVGERITISVRRFRPVYQAATITRA
jgi:hypothetical protein